MHRALLAVTGAFALGTAVVLADDAALGVGRVPSANEIASRMISVAPSGAGLPEGRGNAREGRRLYDEQCAACHGARGEGVGDYPALVGGRDTLTTGQPVYTVGSYWPYSTTVWDYINRAMPYADAGTLSPSEVYAVTAYVLYLNGIVPETLSLDRKTLPRVRMPNRDGFVDDPRPDVPSHSSAASTQASTQ
jgi:cytochrome c